MKKELQAVVRDIEDVETARSAWEDKCWDLDATLTRKFKELEALSIECNQAIRRLKLSNDIRYVLNAKVSTPAERDKEDMVELVRNCPSLKSTISKCKLQREAKHLFLHWCWHWNTMAKLLERVPQNLNYGVYGHLIQYFGDHRLPHQAKQLHARLVLHSVTPDNFLSSKLVTFYSKSNNLLQARHLFDKIS
ncbi:hypothetical protein LWI29_005587 [Acer saccharum]|uniref:Uncharacterized protein n=1 Tax=Acer saccharum TaxID=4024 RepID=A0AA39W220_ACESA|nr:hypothetical protein LWI29_005587 [Acer saccharum]